MDNQLVISSFEKTLIAKKSQLDKIQQSLDQLNKEINVWKESLILVKACIEEASKNRVFIEEIVTEGLCYIFETDYQFKFITVYDSETNEVKGIKPAIIYDNNTITEIEKTLGSGVEDTTDALLHLACLCVQKKTRKIYFGDEVLNSLSSYRFSRFGEYLISLCELVEDLQIVLNTHHSTAFGKIYEVKQNNGISTITEIQ